VLTIPSPTALGCGELAIRALRCAVSGPIRISGIGAIRFSGTHKRVPI
jgi:hypothetical protein